jgi:DNA-binding transcriptional ArsR family regulator
MTGYDKQAKLFKALMHPARLAILDVLRDSEQCVCHLEYLLGYRQAYISQQLSVLRENGLVQDRRDGLNIYYSTAKTEVYALIDQAAHMTGVGPIQAVQKMTHRATQKPCTCPKCSQVVAAVRD